MALDQLGFLPEQLQLFRNAIHQTNGLILVTGPTGSGKTRTILYNANLSDADLNSIRLFYGSPEIASPRTRTEEPNYETGEHTGAVVENANFTNVRRMSESVRYYCCAWCGEQTRGTIPGGCEGIPNKLGTI